VWRCLKPPPPSGCGAPSADKGRGVEVQRGSWADVSKQNKKQTRGRRGDGVAVVAVVVSQTCRHKWAG
jgi:hypothetical protein